jgi:hypothetical protein
LPITLGLVHHSKPLKPWLTQHVEEIEVWPSAYEALAGKTPAIGPTKAHPADYALTIIGTPVWAGNMAMS